MASVEVTIFCHGVANTLCTCTHKQRRTQWHRKDFEAFLPKVCHLSIREVSSRQLPQALRINLFDAPPFLNKNVNVLVGHVPAAMDPTCNQSAMPALIRLMFLTRSSSTLTAWAGWRCVWGAECLVSRCKLELLVATKAGENSPASPDSPAVRDPWLWCCGPDGEKGVMMVLVLVLDSFISRPAQTSCCCRRFISNSSLLLEPCRRPVKALYLAWTWSCGLHQSTLPTIFAFQLRLRLSPTSHGLQKPVIKTPPSPSLPTSTHNIASSCGTRAARRQDLDLDLDLPDSSWYLTRLTTARYHLGLDTDRAGTALSQPPM